MRERLDPEVPLGRPGKPEEVAALVAFLCTDEAAYITGSSYVMDGRNDAASRQATRWLEPQSGFHATLRRLYAWVRDTRGSHKRYQSGSHTMKTLMTICAAAVALAVPAGALAHSAPGALAHDGHGMHHTTSGRIITVRSSRSSPVPGTSFGATSATASGTVAGNDALSTGTFAASLSTDWAAATTKTSDHGTLSCAPATATLTLTGATTTNTVSSPLTGKTCTWTKTDGTKVSAFFRQGHRHRRRHPRRAHRHDRPCLPLPEG